VIVVCVCLSVCPDCTSVSRYNIPRHQAARSADSGSEPKLSAVWEHYFYVTDFRPWTAVDSNCELPPDLTSS